MLDGSMTAARRSQPRIRARLQRGPTGRAVPACGRFTDAVLSSWLDVDLNDTPDLPTASFGQAVLARVEAVLGRTYSARMHADAAIARAATGGDQGSRHGV